MYPLSDATFRSTDVLRAIDIIPEPRTHVQYWTTEDGQLCLTGEGNGGAEQ